jgi:hypothetical protein
MAEIITGLAINDTKIAYPMSLAELCRVCRCSCCDAKRECVSTLARAAPPGEPLVLPSNFRDVTAEKVGTIRAPG